MAHQKIIGCLIELIQDLNCDKKCIQQRLLREGYCLTCLKEILKCSCGLYHKYETLCLVQNHLPRAQTKKWEDLPPISIYNDRGQDIFLFAIRGCGEFVHKGMQKRYAKVNDKKCVLMVKIQDDIKEGIKMIETGGQNHFMSFVNAYHEQEEGHKGGSIDVCPTCPYLGSDMYTLQFVNDLLVDENPIFIMKLV